MIIDEFLVKIGVEADTDILNTINQMLEQTGATAEQFVDAVASSFEQFSDELDKLEQSAQQGFESLTQNLDPQTFEKVFGGLDEQSRQLSEQFDRLVRELVQLEAEAKKLDDPTALQAFIDKSAELQGLTQNLGEAFKAEFGEIVGAVAVASQQFSGELEKMAQSAGNAEKATDKLGKQTESTSQTLGKETQASEQASKALQKQTEKTEANTQANKENEKSLDGMVGELGNLVIASLGLEQAKGAFDKLDGSVKSLPKTLGLVSVALGAVVAGLSAFVSRSLDGLDAIYQLHNVTGEASDYIYQLGKVAETSGSSVAAAENSIKGLSQVIGEAAVGKGRGAKAFELYGLSAKKANGEIKKSSEMLEEIRAKMVGMSQQEKIAMLSKLGIDESMIQVLMKSADEFREEMEKNAKLTLGVGTDEDTEKAAAFKDALADLAKILKAVGEFIALRLAPIITDMITKFKAWFIANNDLIKDGLSLFAGILGGILDGIFGLLDAIDYVISSTLGWRNLLLLLGATMLWLSRRMLMAFATNPFTWISLAIVGVLLLLDDFFTYMNGGESLFGDFWKPFVEAWQVASRWIEQAKIKINDFIEGFIKGWQKANVSLEPIKTAFSVLWTALDNLWGVLKRIFEAIFGTSKATANWGEAGEEVGNLLASAFKIVLIVIEWIAGAVAGLVTTFGFVFELVSNIVIGVFNAIGAVWDALVEGWTSGDWLSAFSKMFQKLQNIVTGVWDNIKRAAIEFINGLIAIVNKFGASIDPIEVPIKQTVETVQVGGGIAGLASSISQAAEMGANASNVAKSGVATNNQTDNSVKNSNNKITVNQTINATAGQDPKAIGNQSAKAVANAYSPIVA